MGKFAGRTLDSGVDTLLRSELGPLNGMVQGLGAKQQVSVLGS